MTAAPPIEGFVAAGLEPVRAAFEANFAAGEELGAAFAATLDGETVVDLRGGFADRQRTRAWTRDTLVPVFSTTKPVAALVVARLVERGLVDYDQPLAELWPEFGAAGKDRVTVAEALSHQAGVPGFPDPIDPDLWLDPPGLARALAALAPMWPPGTGSGYHPITWGYIAGEIVRRADGRSLGTVLREEICAPLEIDFMIGAPAGEHARIADMQRPTAPPDLGDITDAKRAAFLARWAAPDRNRARWREIELPSANGHGGALAVARLYEAYARMGRIGAGAGAAVISPKVWTQLTRSRVSGPDRVLPYDLDFAAGVMRNRPGAFGPNPHTLGHAGWGGSIGLGDPDRGLAAAYVMNRQTNQLLGDGRSQRLIAAVYGCL